MYSLLSAVLFGEGLLTGLTLTLMLGALFGGDTIWCIRGCGYLDE